MKNPFRHESIRSQGTPLQIIERLRGESVAYESIVNCAALMESYTTFVKESLSGGKKVVAKIDGNHFELMPIGMWPAKGQTATASMGVLKGTIHPRGDGSQIDLWYRMPMLWTIFVFTFFVVTCLFSLLWAGILIYSPPPEEDRLALIAFIFGFPAFVLLIAALGLAAASQQFELLRCFVRNLCEEDIRGSAR